MATLKRASADAARAGKRIKTAPCASADHALCKLCLEEKPLGAMHQGNLSTSYCVACTTFYKRMRQRLGTGRLPKQSNFADLVREARAKTDGRAALLAYAADYPTAQIDAEPRYAAFYAEIAARLGRKRLPTQVDFRQLVAQLWQATDGQRERLVYYVPKQDKPRPMRVEPKQKRKRQPAPAAAPAPAAPAAADQAARALLEVLRSQAPSAAALQLLLADLAKERQAPEHSAIFCAHCERLAPAAEFGASFATLGTCGDCRAAQVQRWVDEAAALAAAAQQPTDVDAAAVIDLLRAQRGICPRSRVPIVLHNHSRWTAQLICVGPNHFLGNWQLVCPEAIKML